MSHDHHQSAQIRGGPVPPCSYTTEATTYIHSALLPGHLFVNDHSLCSGSAFSGPAYSCTLHHVTFPDFSPACSGPPCIFRLTLRRSSNNALHHALCRPCILHIVIVVFTINIQLRTFAFHAQT